MKHFAAIFVGLALSGMHAGCKPQTAPTVVTGARVGPTFSPLPASTASPVKVSLPALAGWKSVGDLTVPFYNDEPGRPTFSPDGKWVAAAGFGNGLREGGKIFVWDAKTRVLTKKLEVTEQQMGYFERLAWSPDSQHIAAWPRMASEATPSKPSIIIWNVASGEVQSSAKYANAEVTSACYSNDGSLIVAWSNSLNPMAQEGGFEVQREGKPAQKVELKNRFIAYLLSRKNGRPLALVVDKVGEIGGEPLGKTSLCLWENNQLSAPLIEFNDGEILLTMELSQNGKLLVLSGAKQPTNLNQSPTGPLYAACDLKSRKVLWRSQPKGIGTTFNLSLSPAGERFWAHTTQLQNQPCFATRTGTITRLKSTDIPYFSSNGKRAVLKVSGNRGQKPYLSTFHVFEK